MTDASNDCSNQRIPVQRGAHDAKKRSGYD